MNPRAGTCRDYTVHVGHLLDPDHGRQLLQLLEIGIERLLAFAAVGSVSTRFCLIFVVFISVLCLDLQ